MAKKWGFGFRKYGKGYNYYNDDKNVVKIVKPDGAFIPVHVTTGIYQPSSQELVGKRVEVINLANVQKYCESEIFGRKGVRTSIVMDDCTIYVLETWQQLDALVQKAIESHKGKCSCKQNV